MNAVKVRGDERRGVYRIWSRWMDAAGEQAARWAAEQEDAPFAYNETASVSILTAAAVQAGGLAIADYVMTKGEPTDRRWARNGRCDLWVSQGDCCWAFEFKQANASAKGVRGLKRAFDAAVANARCVRAWEGARVAGLVINLYRLEKRGFDAATKKIEMLIDQEADYAWKIGGAGVAAGGTYFLFKLID